MTPRRPEGRVLIVDDEPEILATLSAIVSARGFEVYTAPNVSDALRIVDDLGEGGLDAVVCDIQLPGASGVDLLAAIRDRSSDVAVLLFSGVPSVESAAAAVRLGAFDYLTKPVSGTQLVDILRRAMERRAAIREDRRAAVDNSLEVERLRGAIRERTDELEASHARYRQLVDSLDVLVFEVDVHSRCFTHVGGALGRRAVKEGTDAGSLEVLDLVERSDRLLVERYLARVVEQGLDGLGSTEFRLRLVDGSARWVRCIPSSLSGRGPTLLFAGVMIDVTEVREAEERRAKLEIALASARQEVDRKLLRDLEPVGSGSRELGSVRPTVAFEPEFGTSASMDRARRAASLAAEHDEPVLITGETGTGKGVFAEYIHRRSRRAKGPFIALNCASLRGDLLASELFGHSKGAFTSADRNRKGLVEEAEGGTLFLDELGEMGLEVQGQLLKVLEEKTFRRVGETTQRKSDFRLLCATHRDLRDMVDSGGFRRDLLYRIDVFRVNVPALRERSEDILPIARNLLARAGVSDVTMGTDTERFLERLPWHGNVRELRSALIRASLLARGDRLRPEHFEDFVALDDADVARAIDKELRVSEPPVDQDSNEDDRERTEVEALLRRFDGNRAKVARALGIARSTLYRKLERWKIEP